MKNIIVTTGIILFLSGCNTSKDHWSLRSSTTLNGSSQAAEFIINCAEAANPLSDEEGEDLVSQCERTATKIYGVEEFYAWNKDTWEKTCYSGLYETTYNCMKDRGLLHEIK
ncbi:hypothetical protein AXI64_gp122 [Vibrio phage qdvp001]|uniref:hypothetical protein n=1 Tax=Vibrio phage qdvp001 TaxID=1003177 RepID=UPI00071F6763|nr:hypothetical protein AXI64_gp122 [Vibrio phage qdvp001]ALM62114.1 hypothetical protein qdvp001_122 [Vibrio phage qdvp001]